MKTNEELTKELEALKDIVAGIGKTTDEHAAAIKTLTAATPASAIAKKAEKPKVPTRADLDKVQVKVTYNANAGKEGAPEDKKTGMFSIKVPILHYEGEHVPAGEAIKNPTIMTWYVEKTWLGGKNNTPFVKEWV